MALHDEVRGLPLFFLWRQASSILAATIVRTLAGALQVDLGRTALRRMTRTTLRGLRPEASTAVIALCLMAVSQGASLSSLEL